MINDIRNRIETRYARSAWQKGITLYALEMLDDLEMNINDGYYTIDDIINPETLRKAVLNGAHDWSQYSWGGCSLCYDHQIAKRLCAPWELRKTCNGAKQPNSHENWLDVQTRALSQAFAVLRSAIRHHFEEV